MEKQHLVAPKASRSARDCAFDDAGAGLASRDADPVIVEHHPDQIYIMDRDYRRDERRRPGHREHKPRYQEIVRAHHPNETAAMTADETVLPTKAPREEAVHVIAEIATTHPEADNRLHHLHETPIPILEAVDLHQAAHAPSKPNSSPYRT
ncbi:hypothetical protein KC356_g190 [Hortaea werneckii]|nr:hypothetical protein KC356_g190 [Hortaea werneckii]